MQIPEGSFSGTIRRHCVENKKKQRLSFKSGHLQVVVVHAVMAAVFRYFEFFTESKPSKMHRKMRKLITAADWNPVIWFWDDGQDFQVLFHPKNCSIHLADVLPTICFHVWIITNAISMWVNIIWGKFNRSVTLIVTLFYLNMASDSIVVFEQLQSFTLFDFGPVWGKKASLKLWRLNSTYLVILWSNDLIKWVVTFEPLMCDQWTAQPIKELIGHEFGANLVLKQELTASVFLFIVGQLGKIEICFGFF